MTSMSHTVQGVLYYRNFTLDDLEANFLNNYKLISTKYKMFRSHTGSRYMAPQQFENMFCVLYKCFTMNNFNFAANNASTLAL